jgi:8-hydroxy-5-deazaflavin:NADPH oxidoreductase
LRFESLQETGTTAAPLTAAFFDAEVIVLAVPFGAVATLANALPNWRGRVVIDCTNAIGPGLTLLHGQGDSGAEVNARLLSGALLVKSFNAQGAENLSHPTYHGIPASNFYCGDDIDAKSTVRQLIEDVGFEPIDVGELKAARFLEPLTLLWFAASRAIGSRTIGFKVLRD